MTPPPALNRIYAMFLRYLYLHQRSLPRNLEIIFWPVMDLLVWGFVTLYLQKITSSAAGGIVVFLIGAMIFWDILYRAQQTISIPFMEDQWARNTLNLLISPLRFWEWMTAMICYGIVKITVIIAVLAVLAWQFYHYSIGSLGFSLLPLIANLLLFGWALGIFTTGLLLFWGHTAEALIWGIPFLIQPFSAVFYPMSVLPAWLQPVSRMLPSTYVFEGMREVIQNGTLDPALCWSAFGLNFVYLCLAGFSLRGMLVKARQSGRLSRLGND